MVPHSRDIEIEIGVLKNSFLIRKQSQKWMKNKKTLKINRIFNRKILRLILQLLLHII